MMLQTISTLHQNALNSSVKDGDYELENISMSLVMNDEDKIFWYNTKCPVCYHFERQAKYISVSHVLQEKETIYKVIVSSVVITRHQAK